MGQWSLEHTMHTTGDSQWSIGVWEENFRTLDGIYVKNTKIKIYKYWICSLTPSHCMSESPLPTTHSPRGAGGRAGAPQCEGSNGGAFSHSLTSVYGDLLQFMCPCLSGFTDYII